jgi:hypothetical protein
VVPAGKRLVCMEFPVEEGRTAPLTEDQLDRLAPGEHAQMVWNPKAKRY